MVNLRPEPTALILLLAVLVQMNSARADEEISGHIELGLREVDVQGDENKYDQYLNLDSGARLFGFNTRITPTEPNGSVPDLIDLQIRGLGGEPYESALISVKKYGAYRFRYRRHKSDYFYEDLLIRPEDASSEGSTGGDFHHFDFERVRDAANLDIELSARTTLNIDFNRYEKTGDSTTTVDVEREEFEIEQPIDEVWRDYRIGLQHSWERATVTIGERWQRHENELSWFLPGFSSGSDPTEPTELDFFFLDQPYDSDLREHSLGISLQPSDKLALALEVRDIDLDLDIDATESSQGIDFLNTPFTREVRGGGGIDRDTTLVEATGSYTVTERLQLGASLRNYDLDQDAIIAFDNATTTSRWAVEHLGVELSAQVFVSKALSLGVGVHRETRDTEFAEFAGDDTFLRDEDTEQQGYFVAAQYTPVEALRLSFEFRDNQIDDPYTRASATDARRYRVRARYRVNDRWSLTASHRRTDYENEDTDWESSTEQSNLRAAYTTPRFTVSAAISRIDVDHEIDQLVSGGFRTDRFDIRYASEATFLHLNAELEVNDRLRLLAGLRTYDNDGSFEVERDDAELAAVLTLPRDYSLQLSYRNVDYHEDRLESFAADIWELSLRLDW